VQDIGLARVLAHAGGFGIEPPPAVPSMALGAGEVTLLSLTNAYGAFANGGFVHTPALIRRVEDREGRVLFRAETRRHQAVSEATAFLMADMLADVINRGTGARARREGFTAPAAGKTGTTNDYRDAWFIGFTPAIVAGVWVGFDQPKTIMARGYATELAVPIWARFMKAAAPKSGPWLPLPDRIVSSEVCLVSGHSPTAGCYAVAEVADDGTLTLKSVVGREYFRIGTEPTLPCPIHEVTGRHPS
jgi:membrane carboxypeptidase/penicillin-binding protein